MNEKMIWMQAYLTNITAGVPHTDAVANADAVLKRVVGLND